VFDFLCFRNGRSTQRLTLDTEFSFAARTLGFSNVSEALHTQDLSKVDAVLNFTAGARPESNEFTREEKLLCNKFRSGVEERSANEEEEQRVDSQHSRQEFETNTKPNTCENDNGGKVEKI